MESAYGEANETSEEGQKRYKGRGITYEFQEKEVREPGARRVTWAAFWMRGTTPRAWTKTPMRRTESQPTRTGSAASFTSELHGEKLNLTEGRMACGDEGGGERGGDARCRRCGRGWT
eukprot:9482067-Pyramimonas_sp.AAC.1